MEFIMEANGSRVFQLSVSFDQFITKVSTSTIKLAVRLNQRREVILQKPQCRRFNML